MADKKADQNKQMMVVLALLAVLGALWFFKLKGSPGGGPPDVADMESIPEAIPKAQSLDEIDVGYVPDEVKDPFRFPKEMFKSPEDGTSLFEEDMKPEIAVELPPMAIRGVLLSKRPSVVIDNKVVRIGESIYEAKVLEIQKDKIVFEYMGEMFEQLTPIMTAEGFTTIPDLPEGEGPGDGFDGSIGSNNTPSLISGMPQDATQSFSPNNYQANVNISGSISFKEYKDGNIAVMARIPGGKDAKVTISEPGPFTLSVPAQSQSIYISAINVLEDRSLAKLPFGTYEKNAITVGEESIDGVNITIKDEFDENNGSAN